MALGILFLIFVGMCLAAIVGVVLLFWLKTKKGLDVLLVLLTVYSLVIAFMGASGEPMNYVIQQVIHWLIGSVAIIGTSTRFIAKKQSVISKVLVSISVFAGIYYTFLS